MLNRFATCIACTILVLNSSTSNAQDRNSKPLIPVPDPVFSPELASFHQVKGNLLLDALNDIETSRIAERQTASEARQEAARLLAYDWSLKFKLDEKGDLLPGSSQYERNLGRQQKGASGEPTTSRIPKGVVLLAIQMQQSQIDSIDSGLGEEHAGITTDELDLICGPDWIITWLEDENGNMIDGSAELYCGGQSFPLPL